MKKHHLFALVAIASVPVLAASALPVPSQHETTGTIETTGSGGKICIDGTYDPTTDSCVLPPAAISNTGAVVSDGSLSGAVTTTTVASGQLVGADLDLAGGSTGNLTTVTTSTGITTGNLPTPVDLSNLNVGGETVKVEKAVTLTFGSTGSLTIESTESTGLQITIENNTTILAPAGWDGKLVAPKKLNTDSNTLPAGYESVDTGAIIQFGSNVPLLFDAPVRILLTNAGTSGKPAYVPTGGTTWNIIEPCSIATFDTKPNDLGFGAGQRKECYQRSGTNVVIWTLHATSFGVLNASTGGGAPAGTRTGGGGGTLNPRDVCPNGDNSPSYYDRTCEATGSTVEASSGFTDVSDSFAKDDINDFAKKGLLKGYEDRTFRPNKPITRAEFLAVAMKGLALAADSTGTVDFTDIPNDHWVSPYVLKAKKLGVVSGQIIDGKLKFRPNDPITRAEATAILLNVAKIEKNLQATTSAFTDVNEPWMFPYLTKAHDLGIVSGQTIEGKLRFRPNDPITRAEAVRIINKVLGLSK